MWHSLEPSLVREQLHSVASALPCSEARVVAVVSAPEDYVVAAANRAAAGASLAASPADAVSAATARMHASLSALLQELGDSAAAGDIAGTGLSTSCLRPSAATGIAGGAFALEAKALLQAAAGPAFCALFHPLTCLDGGLAAHLREHLGGPPPPPSALGVPGTAPALVATAPLTVRQVQGGSSRLLLEWPRTPLNGPACVAAELRAAQARFEEHLAPALASEHAEEREAGQWLSTFMHNAVSGPLDALAGTAGAAGYDGVWRSWQEHLLSTGANLNAAFEAMDDTTATLVQQVFMASSRQALALAGRGADEALVADGLMPAATPAALTALFSQPAVTAACIEAAPSAASMAQYMFQAPDAPAGPLPPDAVAGGPEWAAAALWAAAEQ